MLLNTLERITIHFVCIELLTWYVLHMRIAILGVPMDLGAGRRGVDMGPSALRYAQLAESLRALGHDVTDLGNVNVPVVETIHRNGTNPHYLEQIRGACQEAAERLQALEAGVMPIAIGGDHSMSMGTVAGAARGERIGLVWVDAHTDFNTPETSPSGNIHGMPVASLVGLGDEQLVNIGGVGAKIRPQDIVMIGIRSVDRGERELLRHQGATVYTMKEVDTLGMARIAGETLEKLRGVGRIHVSFDADSLDPSIAPGVGTPVPGGLSYREAHLLMELLSDSGKIGSLDLVEVNPVLDRENMTAKVMVEMACSLLGKRIL
jgi:arginase